MLLRLLSTPALAAIAAVLLGCASGPAPQGHIVFSRFDHDPSLILLPENQTNPNLDLLGVTGDGYLLFKGRDAATMPGDALFSVSEMGAPIYTLAPAHVMAIVPTSTGVVIEVTEQHRRSLVVMKGDGSARRTLIETDDDDTFTRIGRLPGGFLIFNHSPGHGRLDLYAVREDGAGLRRIARHAYFEAFLPDLPSLRPRWRGTTGWPTFQPEVEPTRVTIR